jgi:hypothetical protein
MICQYLIKIPLLWNNFIVFLLFWAQFDVQLTSMWELKQPEQQSFDALYHQTSTQLTSDKRMILSLHYVMVISALIYHLQLSCFFRVSWEKSRNFDEAFF